MPAHDPSDLVDPFVRDHLPPPPSWPQFLPDPPGFAPVAGPVNAVAVLFERARAARQGGDHPLLRDPVLSLGLHAAQDRIHRLASALRRPVDAGGCGLVPGQRVLLRAGNSVGLALAWLAVVQAGLVAVATMPLLRAKELAAMAAKAQPALALCDPALLTDLVAARELAQGTWDIRPLDPQREPPWAQQATADPALAVYCGDPDHPALLAFTSGTTGAPKAAVHSHRQVLAACAAWPVQVLGLGPADVVVGTPPLAFTFGLGGLLLFPLACGAQVVFGDRPYTPDALVAYIRRTGATVCFTAPTFYRQMAPHLAADLATHGPGTLRHAVSAGEALPEATRSRWRGAGGPELLDGIGATELFHIFISGQPGVLHRGPWGLALGQVVPGYQARVVGPQGQALPPGQVGRLAVIGPTGCRYLDDARQASYVVDGWNQPGDAFVMDDGGWFYYRARADDLIISAGYNIAGPEVEDALMAHPQVAECAVVGLPDEERGMVVAAWVVLRPGASPDAHTARALQDFVKQQIAPYKYPRQLRFVPALPRTETGKLQRFKLRDPATDPGPFLP